VEEAGEAIIAKIQKVAYLSNENCDRAMKLAHKLSMQLRVPEDRINQLEAEVELFRDRAACAELLQTIQKEIEEKSCSESSQRHRTDVASQGGRVMTSVESGTGNATSKMSAG